MIWWYIYVVEYCCTKYHVDVKILSNFVSDLKSAFISDLKSAKKTSYVKVLPIFWLKTGAKSHKYLNFKGKIARAILSFV
jgi:hypothetical protein